MIDNHIKYPQNIGSRSPYKYIMCMAAIVSTLNWVTVAVHEKHILPILCYSYSCIHDKRIKHDLRRSYRGIKRIWKLQLKMSIIG